MIKILLMDDHQDTLENLTTKIPISIPNTIIIPVGNCDHAYYYLQQDQGIKLFISDLTIQNSKRYKIQQGKDLLKLLQKEEIEVPTIIYTDHHDLETILPIIDNYNPVGFVLKNNFSHEDLFLAIKKALRGESHYTHYINTELKHHAKFEYSIDDTDELIIQELANISSSEEWATSKVTIGERSIRDRLIKLREKFGVNNNKQLLLKLQRLGFLREK